MNTGPIDENWFLIGTLPTVTSLINPLLLSYVLCTMYFSNHGTNLLDNTNNFSELNKKCHKIEYRLQFIFQTQILKKVDCEDKFSKYEIANCIKPLCSHRYDLYRLRHRCR